MELNYYNFNAFDEEVKYGTCLYKNKFNLVYSSRVNSFSNCCKESRILVIN